MNTWPVSGSLGTITCDITTRDDAFDISYLKVKLEDLFLHFHLIFLKMYLNQIFISKTILNRLHTGNDPFLFFWSIT